MSSYFFTGAVVATALLLADTALAESPVPGAKADCKAEWPGDFAMQEYCLQRQIKAFNAMVPVFNDEKNPDLRGALDMCMADWKSPNGHDWAMVEYCYGRQMNAYQRLKK